MVVIGLDGNKDAMAERGSDGGKGCNGVKDYDGNKGCCVHDKAVAGEDREEEKGVLAVP
jgi:hypothetical protein